MEKLEALQGVIIPELMEDIENGESKEGEGYDLMGR